MSAVHGVSHPYAKLSAEESRNYTLHFIRFGDLEPRTVYHYKVKGGASSAWSPVFQFRTVPTTGETRMASYGDMGHSHYNCMGNLKADCESGVVDGILHMPLRLPVVASDWQPRGQRR